MKAVIHKTGKIGEVLGVERRDGIDYVYFESGLCKPVSEVGFLNPYEQYMEDVSDWSDFRREAAKDIFCAMMMSGIQDTWRIMAENAITATDELIKQLREEKK